MRRVCWADKAARLLRLTGLTDVRRFRFTQVTSAVRRARAPVALRRLATAQHATHGGVDNLLHDIREHIAS